MDGVLDDNMLLIRYIYKHCRFRQHKIHALFRMILLQCWLMLMLSKITCHQGCVIKVMTVHRLSLVCLSVLQVQ